METIMAYIVELLKIISRILNTTDDEALGWIFGKGAELLDDNKDKIIEGVDKAE